MSKWITDRRPTEDEVAANEFTMAWNGSRVCAISGASLRSHATDYPWMNRPEPYVPPKLSKSIDAVQNWYDDDKAGAIDMPFGELVVVIEAARKWDAAMKKNDQRPDLEDRLPIAYNGKTAEEWYQLYCRATKSDDDENGADVLVVPHDKKPLDEEWAIRNGFRRSNKQNPTERDNSVGEGWRELQEGETIKDGDEFESKHGEWSPTGDAGEKHHQGDVTRRRRIEINTRTAEPLAIEDELELPKPKQREWWIDNPPCVWKASIVSAFNAHSGPQPDPQIERVHVREVLPGDPTPEVIEEVVSFLISKGMTSDFNGNAFVKSAKLIHFANKLRGKS